MTSEQSPSSQRVDQWLWQARLTKSRSLAARLVAAGVIRINREKISKPGHHLKIGDVLTFMHAGRLHVVKVLATAKRRGPAAEARQLYCNALDPDCEQSTHSDEKGDA